MEFCWSFLPGAPLSIKQKLGSSSPPVAAVKPSMLYVKHISQALEALWMCILLMKTCIAPFPAPAAIVIGSGKSVPWFPWFGVDFL